MLCNGRRGVVWLAVFALLAGLPITLWGQAGGTGSISGIVMDPSGKGVPQANLAIINQATGVTAREFKATGSGEFTATSLTPGAYRIEVTAAGFARFVAPDIIVRVTETTYVIAKMKVGALTQTVTVTGVATAVNVSNPATGETVGSDVIPDLPNANRNFLTLLALSAGTNSELVSTATIGREEVSMSVNGQRPVNNNYQLEGINTNDINLPILDNVAVPNPNTIQEFRTQTSLYDASMGRNGGGNIQVTLRSGSAAYHGEVYGFLRNTVFNADDVFLKGERIDRPNVRQGQYGVSLGGPIPDHHGRWWKDWFFFFNYQGTRAASAQAPGTTMSISTLPVFPVTRDAPTLTADFFPQGLPTQANGSPYAINPVALAFLNLSASKCPGFNDGTFCIPTLAGTPGLVGNVNSGAVNIGPTLSRALLGVFFENQFSARGDKQLDRNDHLSASFFSSTFNSAEPFGGASSLPFARTLPNTNRFIALRWTRTLNPSTVNQARFGFSRFTFARVPTEPVSLSDIGATRGNSSVIPAAFQIGVVGFFSLGTGVNDDRGGHFNTYYVGDDFSHTVGKHTLRAGFEASRYQLNRFNRFATRGSVSFNKLAVPVAPGGCPGASPGATACKLNAVQNFLLGNVNTTQGAAGFFNFFFRATDYAWYAQDDWKVAPRFTLNIGFRHELLSTAHEKHNSLSNFEGLGDGSGVSTIHIIHPADTLRVGTPGVTSCTLLTCLRTHNFAPRMGFAWDVFGDQKAVVRAGYGIYWQRTSNQPLLQTAGGLPFNEPFSASPLSVTFQNPFPSSIPDSAFPLSTDQVVPKLLAFCSGTGADPSGTLAKCTPGTPIFQNAKGRPLSGFFFFPVRNLVSPYAQQWNLTIESDLSRLFHNAHLQNWVLDLGYIGTRGVHLLGTGRPLNPSQICTLAVPCIIPPAIASTVLVNPGTPDVVKNTDGTISITANTVANRNARVPPLYLGLANSRGFFQENAGASTYHSFQATLSHQWSNGLYLQGAYTFSRSIDNGSGSAFGDELNGLTQFGDLFNVHSNRGLSDFDRKHRLVVSYRYVLPFAKLFGVGNHGFGKFVNGWEVGGVTVFQSGTPFIVVDSGALLLEDVDGVNSTNFATLLPGQTVNSVQTPGDVTQRVSNYIDLTQFGIANSVPAVGNLGGPCVDNQNNIVQPVISNLDPGCATGFSALGNIGRNVFRGPYQQNWNISIAKETKVTERSSVTFRADFFNAFNHPAFQSPQSAGGSFGNYGIVDLEGGSSAILSTVNGSRIVQLGLSIKF